MPEPIRTLIIDDEPPARRRIRELLDGMSDIVVDGECVNGAEAIKSIRESQPELIFLDIQMPAVDGFGVLENLAVEKMPMTIFVTAYDRYALRAFEVSALDYLLKPFSDERFAMTLERAKRHLRNHRPEELNEHLLAFMQRYTNSNSNVPSIATAKSAWDRLVIKTAGRIFFLKTEEIDWVEGAGVYSKLHTAGKTHLYRETVGGLEAQLDPCRFVRVHRSSLVNIDRIKELQHHSHGEFIIILKDETRLKLSRNYRDSLQNRLGQSL